MIRVSQGVKRTKDRKAQKRSYASISQERKKGKMKKKTITLKFKAGENGSISGYAATFIREPDSYGDVIKKGAFADCIKRYKDEGKVIPLLWNHDSYSLDAYIGTVTNLGEDEKGLKFDATFDDTENAQRARKLASDGRLCKFSFAYDVLDAGTVTLEDGREVNELRKLDIHEVSLVMYPANPDTEIIDIKAGRRNSKADAGTLKEITEHLSAAQALINDLLAEEEPDDDPEANPEDPSGNEEEQKGIEELIKKADEMLKKGITK